MKRSWNSFSIAARVLTELESRLMYHSQVAHVNGKGNSYNLWNSLSLA